MQKRWIILSLLLSFTIPRTEAQFRTISMPCCQETVGSGTCALLHRRRPQWFERQCSENADFAMLQCCNRCGTSVAASLNGQGAYSVFQKLGQQLFKEGENSPQCFDRHDQEYCLKFLYHMGFWSADERRRAGRLSCLGEGAPLAFRICRKTCGFCRPGLYSEEKRPLNCPIIG